MIGKLSKFLDEISLSSLKILLLGAFTSFIIMLFYLYSLYISQFKSFLFYISLARTYYSLAMALPVVFMIIAFFYDIAEKQRAKQ